MSSVNIIIEEKYYSKDPQSSDLGRKIISESIKMLDQMGYEEFTFKKIANQISSTEASIYRYFENKHKLLLYLATWYWSWLEYMIDYRTHFITNKEEKLREVLKIVCHVESMPESVSASIDLNALRRLVQIESDKTYLTKHVDEINNQGLFMGFKSLCHKISEVILTINPSYKYANAVTSMLLETSHQQAFFALHLPSLTEISKDSNITIETQVYDFVQDTVFKLIENSKK
jgi:AcrR family transcriptional regulator